MKLLLRNTHLILGIGVGAVLVLLISNLTAERKISHLQLSLDTAIDQSLEETTKLALLVGQGVLTKESESIIVDCKTEERALFEAKLNKLDSGLTKAELQTADNLFSRCAPVQPVRRSLMVMELARSTQALEGLIQQRKQIGDYTKYDKDLANLKGLLSTEQKTTELSFALLYLQREILDLLLTGKTVNSEEANALRLKGAKLRNEVQGVAKEANNYREELKSS